MQQTPPPKAGKREWFALAILMLPTLLIVMDATVLHLAVPHLSADLQPSSAQLLWIVDIYGFLIAGSLITMGTLGDRIGRRRLLLIGAAAFGAASTVAAFASTASALIAARALLGVAGATLLPSTMSLIRNMFQNPQERTRAIGIWISGFSAGSAVGPLLGGILLEYFWWGSVFLLNLPVMVLLLVLGPLVLPEFRDEKAGRLDFLSAALSLVAVLTVIFGLKEIAQEGVALLPLLSIVAGLGLGVFFVWRQRTLTDPLLDLSLFQKPAFSVSLVTYTLGVFVAFGSYLFLAQYLQLVLELSPLKAGLWTIPGAVTSIVGSNVAPVLIRHTRPANVISGGLALAAIGFAMIIAVGTDSLGLVVGGWSIMSLGFGATFALTADLVVSTAPPERAGAASALSETGAEFGGALGIAVLGSIGTALYRSQLSAQLPDGITPDAAHAALETLGGAVNLAAQLPARLGGELLAAAQGAFIGGVRLTAILGAIVMIGLTILTASLLRNETMGGEGEHEIEDEQIPAPQPPLDELAVANPTIQG